jgi:ribulose-phosphate 3-epimerase
MPVICPTVLALEPHEYREQVERIVKFAERVHLDFMDGTFAPTRSPGLEQAWWPDGVKIDLHIMYQNPLDSVDTIIRLKPSLVIVHAEADGNFIELATALHDAGIKVGVALLQDTPVDEIKPALEHIDHVLIFSGDLGHFGGTVQPALLSKVGAVKALNPEIEVGWDGGVNDTNAAALAQAGVDVLNVGGFIQKAADPQAAYATLERVLENT